MDNNIIILGIESSCDDTSAAVLRGTTLLSSVIASQAVHEKYGGVIPELASRAHQQNIVPVVDTALKDAGLTIDKVDAIAFTRGPGLLGSLMVGTSFAKGLSIANNIPMVEVNHLHGHILSHFVDLPDRELPHPDYPFLCLLVSGGHTQIVKVDAPDKMEIVGTTIDDAAGEALDKCAKVMGLPYPGGPIIDRLAKEGNKEAFKFAKPRVDELNYLACDAYYAAQPDEKITKIKYADADIQAEAELIATELKSYVWEKIGSWCLGTSDVDAEWDTYLQELEAIGLSDWLEIQQDGWK